MLQYEGQETMINPVSDAATSDALDAIFIPATRVNIQFATAREQSSSRIRDNGKDAVMRCL